MAREGKAPAFQFYAADWLADEAVRTMSLAERGAYIDLLAFCWREGSIPDDATRCARLLGCATDEVRDVWPVVRARFMEGEGGRLVSRRMEEQRAELAEFKGRAGNGGRVAAANMTQEQRVERARKAAQAKQAANEQAEGKQDSANEQADECLLGANGVLASANTASASATASAKRRKTIGGDKPPPSELDAIYARYPRKDGKTAGMKIAAKLPASDLPALARAVDNFAARMRDEGREREHIKQFSTFMNCWRDYLDAPDPVVVDNRSQRVRDEEDAYLAERDRKIAEAERLYGVSRPPEAS